MDAEKVPKSPKLFDLSEIYESDFAKLKYRDKIYNTIL